MESDDMFETQLALLARKDETKINYNDYCQFVKRLAAERSTRDFESMLGTVGLGLAGEAGEIAEIAKSVLDNEAPWHIELRDLMIKELGDMWWYMQFALAYIFTDKDADFSKIEIIDDVTDVMVGSLNDNLRTGSLWLAMSACKISDIVKKVIFHGKDWTPSIEREVYKHLNECYWLTVFLAENFLGCSMNEILLKNVEKLSMRYKELEFSTEASIAKADEDSSLLAYANQFVQNEISSTEKGETTFSNYSALGHQPIVKGTLTGTLYKAVGHSSDYPEQLRSPYVKEAIAIQTFMVDEEGFIQFQDIGGHSVKGQHAGSYFDYNTNCLTIVWSQPPGINHVIVSYEY